MGNDRYMTKEEGVKFKKMIEEQRKQVTPEMRREYCEKRFVWTEEEFKQCCKNK